jgi:hypothetical protein
MRRKKFEVEGKIEEKKRGLLLPGPVDKLIH